MTISYGTAEHLLPKNLLLSSGRVKRYALQLDSCLEHVGGRPVVQVFLLCSGRCIYKQHNVIICQKELLDQYVLRHSAHGVVKGMLWFATYGSLYVCPLELFWAPLSPNHLRLGNACSSSSQKLAALLLYPKFFVFWSPVWIMLQSWRKICPCQGFEPGTTDLPRQSLYQLS